MSEELMSRRNVAELFGVNERTVSRNEASWGLTPIHLSSRSTKYRRTEVEAYLKRQGGGTAPPVIAPKRAEAVVRNLLNMHHFDEETTGELQQVADLLASLQSGKEG